MQVTGAFNISSNMRIEIEQGVHLLGSKDGSDWPLLVVDKVSSAHCGVS
eukprot:SAG11_NODE_1841_length_4182_cov_4.130541_3_plen_49_part_00